MRDIDSFKREHELVPADAVSGDAEAGPRLDDEPDLRAEDDALVAAALDAEPEEDEADDDDESDDDDDKPRKRRRGRRGGRGRRTRSKGPLEGTFDHGDEGYGLWLDPAVQDNGIYAEHWAGHRPVTVTIEADRIVIQRAGDEENGDDDGDEDETTESNMDPDDFDA